jgi:GNAT superfamily N-acetyltransferase
MVMNGVSLVAGTRDDIDRLESLWVGVHHRHQQVMPHLAPYVSDVRTWSSRRSLYRQLLDKDTTRLLLAVTQDDVVGYGLTHVFEASDSWLDDTWVTGADIGEIESLAVAPDYRGQGIGGRLLTRLKERNWPPKACTTSLLAPYQATMRRSGCTPGMGCNHCGSTWALGRVSP